MFLGVNRSFQRDCPLRKEIRVSPTVSPLTGETSTEEEGFRSCLKRTRHRKRTSRRTTSTSHDIFSYLVFRQPVVNISIYVHTISESLGRIFSIIRVIEWHDCIKLS